MKKKRNKTKQNKINKVKTNKSFYTLTNHFKRVDIKRDINFKSEVNYT